MDAHHRHYENGIELRPQENIEVLAIKKRRAAAAAAAKAVHRIPSKH